ncbi:MAG: ATP12 family chaperone protein [Gemmobacter sp.]
MTGWARKRFWAEATVRPEGAGFGVALDARALRTPGKAVLSVPTEALARAIAAEWAAQEGELRPALMPMTRMANTAIDRVAVAMPEVVAEIAGYGGSDLLCYRAEGPAALVARQAQAWDPPLGWARARFGAELSVTRGVVPVAQPAEALARLRAAVAAHDAFGLVGLHDLVAITGSLILGLGVAEGWIGADAAFEAAHLDEGWQAELWGEDAEAAEARAARRAALGDAARFLAALSPGLRALST